jgi:hypothetical protein
LFRFKPWCFIAPSEVRIAYSTKLLKSKIPKRGLELLTAHPKFRGEITDLVSIFKIITDLVSIFKIITDLVSILRLFLRVHSTGTTFVIYLEIDTRSVISPNFVASTTTDCTVYVCQGPFLHPERLQRTPASTEGRSKSKKRRQGYSPVLSFGTLSLS